MAMKKRNADIPSHDAILRKLFADAYAKADSLICADPLIQETFGRNMMLTAFRDATRMRLEAFEKAIAEARAESPSFSKEMLVGQEIGSIAKTSIEMTGRHDPTLLTKISRIYAERDAASMLALEGEVEPDCRLVGEEPQIRALAHEFGSVAVIAALADVHGVRLETSKKVLKLRHLIEDPPSAKVLLIRKIGQIFRETTDLLFVARSPIDENHPGIVALMHEYDRDTVLAELAELTKIWKEAAEQSPASATEAQRDPGTRLN